MQGKYLTSYTLSLSRTHINLPFWFAANFLLGFHASVKQVMNVEGSTYKDQTRLRPSPQTNGKTLDSTSNSIHELGDRHFPQISHRWGLSSNWQFNFHFNFSKRLCTEGPSRLCSAFCLLITKAIAYIVLRFYIGTRELFLRGAEWMHCMSETWNLFSEQCPIPDTIGSDPNDLWAHQLSPSCPPAPLGIACIGLWANHYAYIARLSQSLPPPALL